MITRTLELTPGDMGCLAATYDDAVLFGMGDDDACEMIANTLRSECGVSNDVERTAYRVYQSFLKVTA